MKLEDFNNLDPKNIGNWPIPAKALVVAALCCAGLGAGYYFDTQEQILRRQQAQEKEVTLKKEFTDKQWKAATLPKLREQLTTIEATLAEQQRRLPGKDEVAALIQEVSQAAIASGLRLELFQPGNDINDQMYVKSPIKLRVSGKYHQFGKFVSDVAAMPRIVTQHDVSINSSTGILSMEMTAQIYRYVEEEQKAPPPAAPAKKP
jgi:type IV pilus assembly protein PilO